jgi:hypothetical protein
MLLHQTPRVENFHDLLIMCLHLLKSSWIPNIMLLLSTCLVALVLYCCCLQPSWIPNFTLLLCKLPTDAISLIQLQFMVDYLLHLSVSPSGPLHHQFPHFINFNVHISPLLSLSFIWTPHGCFHLPLQSVGHALQVHAP